MGMREWFSMNVVEIIRVGEAGGALAETMKSAINMLSQRGVAVGAFVGAVSYPLLVIGMACMVIVYMDHAVFPQFLLIKPVSQWPEAGQRLIVVAHLIESWWWAFLLVVLVTTFVLRWLMANYIGEFRPTMDKVPPFSFYRKFVSSRVLETLGLLVANGVVFRSAIKVMQYQANPFLSSHLVMMEHLLSMVKQILATCLPRG